jgi:hypothetical protein
MGIFHDEIKLYDWINLVYICEESNARLYKIENYCNKVVSIRTASLENCWSKIVALEMNFALNVFEELSYKYS